MSGTRTWRRSFLRPLAFCVILANALLLHRLEFHFLEASRIADVMVETPPIGEKSSNGLGREGNQINPLPTVKQNSSNLQIDEDYDPSLQREVSNYKWNRSQTLVVTMASSAQIELMNLWIEARHRPQLVVIALDAQTSRECRERGIDFLYDRKLHMSTGEDMVFKSQAFMRLGLAKFTSLLQIIHAGYILLFSEIDVVELHDPEMCGAIQDKETCVGWGGDFDVEISPNTKPKEAGGAGMELNIGFFLLRPTRATELLLERVIECLDNDCGWDQTEFSKLAWELQCKWRNDNSNSSAATIRNSNCKDRLQIRILKAHYFPTGGTAPKTGIVSPREYKKTQTCPTIVHCTGRTGLQMKLKCARRVQELYGGCRKYMGDQ